MAAHCGVPYGEWKRGLLEAFAIPYLGPDRDVIEIAPGHGRWSETLIAESRSVKLVDLNPECLAACRERFGEAGGVEYLATDGSSIPSPDSSADFIWSFDSFVHIDAPDVFAYLDEFARVLRPGGYAVIHHANMTDLGIALAPRLQRFGKAGTVATRVIAQHMAGSGGNRSRLNGSLVARRAEQAGLHVVQQTDAWGPGGRSRVARFRDVITVMRRPPPR
jgi:ubiquinone/menaquinone biosynthesis C-methylase UbiE